MHSRSASRSEGEYLSSDSEKKKAIRPSSYRSDHRVNRHSRTHSSARSRHSPSRSRSPYRAPRGEKRHREDEHRSSKHDPRTFTVRYEDDRRSAYHSHGDHKSKRSRTYSPSRSRSRSPYRHNREPEKAQVEDMRNIKSQSVSTQDQKSDGVPQLETHAKTVKQNHEQPVSNDINQEYATTDPTPNTSDNSSSASADSTSTVMDEAAMIEARRKRREAIKNQHRSRATPLLVQALHSGPETPADSINTPPNGSVSPPPASASTPTTPAPFDGSAPQSPAANLLKDADSVGGDMFGSPKHADEPSAADYDPTADMQDERARHDKRLFKEDEVSEDKADQRVLEHIKDVEEQPQQKKPELDMFAEDDDDDMFADEPTTKSKPTETAAKTLDVGMMDNWDDAEGYYLTNLREKIDDRYEVTANLGRGMFASVIRARDTKSKDGRSVAIKIIRNNESMRKAGLKEVDILKDLAANDPDDRKHVVRLLRSFDHKGHLCMVFENMDMNLREVLKKFGRDIGLNLKAIRTYAQQLFLGLSLMKKCQYLHADLKPDNILADESRMKIKIADLGSASPITENATAPYLVSRFYRAPEVILGIDYDYGIDMWSTGCTLFELYTGKILFTGRNNNNMLKNIMECRGKFPHKLLRKGSLSYDYFDDLLNFRAQEQDKATGRIVTKMIDIKAKPVRDLRSRLIPKDKKMNEQDRKELESFADLLDKCLDLRPEKRITPMDGLKHPFITRTK
ncbi:U4/U6 small nuclear ribonucleoprotein prp4 [Knufia fluminis]|uniref:non-specific serine/threonine protein kinase n=1 Tax=Knufia fluminis TaxID=191047 RepID=A0AAN8EEN6_9EURO|nr:U4/U6 small nuclear ribonucleoprotein prp4 [Knufia fluminis]